MTRNLFVIGMAMLQATLVVAVANESQAANRKDMLPDWGYCPQGTYALDGTNKAMNTRKCKAGHRLGRRGGRGGRHRFGTVRPASMGAQ
jgi:hypothetical protein